MELVKPLMAMFKVQQAGKLPLHSTAQHGTPRPTPPAHVQQHPCAPDPGLVVLPPRAVHRRHVHVLAHHVLGALEREDETTQSVKKCRLAYPRIRGPG